MEGVKDILSNGLGLIPPQFVPVISVGMIVIAILLVIIFFGICVIYINAKPKPILRREAPKNESANKTPKKVRHEDLPILSGRFGEILSMYGILKAGPIAKIFFQVLDIMKNSTYDLRWRYKLPCFMITGSEHSGKTTLLNSLDLENLANDGSELNAMWKIFKKGAVFEMPQVELKEEEGKFWSFISELFAFIRPRRPLDGLIVTVPADVLMTHTDIEKYASEMFTKIFQFQHDINFRLPIYLIITKSDLIQGFPEFSCLLHESAKQQMFGWSCPYTINSAFSTAWIDDIFSTLHNGIRKAVLHFAQEKTINEDLERAMLFETNLQKIKSALSGYLNAMFHSHNPSDGLILRGVYFVGLQKIITKPSAELLRPDALIPSLSVRLTYENSYNNSLCFVRDLFTEKIFKEHNLAFPINRNSVNVHQISFRNKLILTTSLAVFSVGWFWGNYNIRNKIQEHYKTLLSIKRAMSQIIHIENNLRSPQERAKLNKRISSLIQSIPNVSRYELTSIFVPQSWFSSLHRDIIHSLGLVFDSVVFRAMYIDLNLNTNNVLHDIDAVKDAQYQSEDLFDVASFKSFKKLQDFTNHIITLEKVSNEYNSIRTLDDRKSIIDLSSVLFNEQFEIAEEMTNQAPNKQLVPPKFDIETFRTKIETGLTNLFSDFLSETFNVTIVQVLQNIARDIDLISAAAEDKDYSQAQLARTYEKITLLTKVLKNEKFSWIAQEHFVPIKEYTELINTLTTSNIISQECVRSLMKLGEIEFQKYKNRLLSCSTTLTGPLLATNIQSPSVGLDKLYAELKVLLDQPFICVVPYCDFSTVILDDKMLLWDEVQLRKLSLLIDKYSAFVEAMPADIREKLHEMYKTVAQKCFIPTIASFLGQAEIFEDMPLGDARKVLEDAYKRQSFSLRNSSAMLLKTVRLLQGFQKNNEDPIGLTKLLVSYYSTLLEKIDAIFNLETPYATGNAVFDNWNGKKSPNFLNYNNKDQVREYLATQFERIRFLAKDLVEPIIDLLLALQATEYPINKQLIAKWKSIISNVNDYEAKKPGNSISALEEFIVNGLGKIKDEGTDSHGEIRDISEIDGDFFLSKRSEIARSLLSRADVIQYDRAAKAYNTLSEFFNTRLSNKFPFGNAIDEVSLNDVETFLNMFENNCSGIVDILELNQNQKNVSESAISFLKNIDKLAPFLKAWIRHAKGSDASTASFLFKVQLRPAPDLEAFTSSVIERDFTIDGVKVDNDQASVFFNGNKIEAIFKWVESSDEQPNDKESTDDMSIQGSKASFYYQGNWAMFRLIEEHKQNGDIEYPEGIILQFNVPIIDRSQNNLSLVSKMILKITPLVKVEDKLAPIAWPIFPKRSPGLHKNMNTNTGSKPLDVNVSFDE